MPWGCGIPRGALQILGDSWEEGRSRGFAARLSHPMCSVQRSLVAPATLFTAGGHSHPPCRGRRRNRHGSEPAAPSAHQHSTWALLTPPAPPGNKPGPEIGHEDAATHRRGRSADAEPSPQQGKPAILPFPPRHSCRVCSRGNSGARLHRRGPLMYVRERTYAC